VRHLKTCTTGRGCQENAIPRMRLRGHGPVTLLMRLTDLSCLPRREPWANRDVDKIGRILVEQARRCIKEVADLISENYGTVQVERAIHGQPMVKDSQLLGVACEPPKLFDCDQEEQGTSMSLTGRAWGSGRNTPPRARGVDIHRRPGVGRAAAAFDLSQCLVVTLTDCFRRTSVTRREMKGICRLCGQHSERQLNHIIPRLVFAWTKSTCPSDGCFHGLV